MLDDEVKALETERIGLNNAVNVLLHKKDADGELAACKLRWVCVLRGHSSVYFVYLSLNSLYPHVTDVVALLMLWFAGKELDKLRSKSNGAFASESAMRVEWGTKSGVGSPYTIA